MKIISETDRLVLRELEPRDAPGMYALNLDPAVLRYTGDVPFRSIEEARVFLENYSEYRENGFGRWAVLSKGSGEFIGWCGLKRNEVELVDLGFRFFRKHWNQGFATEAARACLCLGFETFALPQIIGRAAGANKASIRVLGKIGMSFWKKVPVEGLEEACYYSIGASTYQKITPVRRMG